MQLGTQDKFTPNCKVTISRSNGQTQKWEEVLTATDARITLERDNIPEGHTCYRLIIPLRVLSGKDVNPDDKVELVEAKKFPQLKTTFKVILSMIDPEALSMELLIVRRAYG